MNVKLIAHTALSEAFFEEIHPIGPAVGVNERAAVALTAIRTCYSANKPSEIVAKEGAKYFGQSASDGEGGTEADRLIRHIVASKHLSTLEHISYTFAIEGVSRALLAQLTRHRDGFSFSVQSQRYVRFGSDDKTGGMDYVTPPSVKASEKTFSWWAEEDVWTAERYYEYAMEESQKHYDALRSLGVPPEDARMVLPNAATCNLVMTGNLRSLLDFFGKRRAGNGSQWEIADLAERLREAVINVDPWTEQFFERK